MLWKDWIESNELNWKGLDSLYECYQHSQSRQPKNICLPENEGKAVRTDPPRFWEKGSIDMTAAMGLKHMRHNYGIKRSGYMAQKPFLSSKQNSTGHCCSIQSGR